MKSSTKKTIKRIKKGKPRDACRGVSRPLLVFDFDPTLATLRVVIPLEPLTAEVSSQYERVSAPVLMLDTHDDGVETDVSARFERSGKPGGCLEGHTGSHVSVVHVLHVHEQQVSRRSISDSVPGGGHTSTFLFRHLTLASGVIISLRQ